MATIQIEVTKLFNILSERGLTQIDFQNLIRETNDGKAPSMYILNEMINGKRKNYEINTLKCIKKALGVSYDDLIDEN
jgi:hypothetical protein